MRALDDTYINCNLTRVEELSGLHDNIRAMVLTCNSMNRSIYKRQQFKVFFTEAVIQRCSVKKVFQEILQNWQENTRARVSFLIKLHAWGLQFY